MVARGTSTSADPGAWAVEGASTVTRPVLRSDQPPPPCGGTTIGTDDRGHGDTVNELLVLLLIGWAALMVPSVLRSRASSPHVTVGGFERAMDVLRSDARASRSSRSGPGPGRQVLVPGQVPRTAYGAPGGPAMQPPVRHRPEPPVLASRRRWFVRLLAASGSTLLLASVVGGWVWLVTVPVLIVTVGYVALLRKLKLQRDQARQVVRQLRVDPLPTAHAGAPQMGAAVGHVQLRRWDA